MAGRHSLSKPRPISGLTLPTWEVDVLREGVEEPILTLLVDENTLPPRMRKRKVVWKLPDTVDVIPNFCADEKRRLMDLFKRLKKNRRKSKRLLSRGDEEGYEDDDTESLVTESLVTESLDPNGTEPPPSLREQHPKRPSKTKQPEVKQNSSAGGNGKAVSVANGKKPALNSPNHGLEQNNGNVAPVVANGTSRKDTSPSKSIREQDGHIAVDSHEHTSPPVPKILTMPPPGFDVSQLALEDPTVTDPQDTLEPPRRFFQVPFLSSTNIPVDVAKCVVDTYYPCLTHGHPDQLLLHYAPQSQKSLSVGGAHAFCHSPHECLVQLQSLQGSRWDVRGVVAQQGLLDSVVLLITGTVAPAANVPLPFCHTLTLMRTENGYQIQNDAMALLTDCVS